MCVHKEQLDTKTTSQLQPTTSSCALLTCTVQCLWRIICGRCHKYHVFVMTKHVLCCNKSMLIMTKLLSQQISVVINTCLSRQKCLHKHTCHDKRCVLSQQTQVCNKKHKTFWFVMTEIYCRDKHNSLATKLLLQQAYYCNDKRCVFVTTKLLLRQRLYLWQFPPMIVTNWTVLCCLFQHPYSFCSTRCLWSHMWSTVPVTNWTVLCSLFQHPYSFCSTRLSVFFHNGVWSPAGCDLLSAHTGNWINHGILCHSQVNAGACFKIKFNVAFTSTETIRIIRDGKPKTSTLTFTQLLSRSLYLTRLIVGTRPCSDL